MVAEESGQVIGPEQFQELRRAGKSIELIDVRTPAEYREAHVDVARSVPLDLLEPEAVMSSRIGSCDEPLYFICWTGDRAEKACKKFMAAGFTNVVKVDGGTIACEKAGVPVVRGKKAVSLERQVRIIAGMLVLLGALMGLVVNPYWVILSAFVGGGLLFAGVTDTCGMALLLARMPWNKA